jgi:hypothetical protein
MRKMFVVACTAGIALFSTAAEAAPVPGDDSSTVAILPPLLSGNAAPELAGELTQAILSGLGRGEFEVIGPDEVSAASPEAANCSEPGCAARAAEAVGASLALQTTVTESSRNYEIRLDVVDASSGEVVGSATETCEICGLTEIAELASDTAAGLRVKVNQLTRGPGKLRVVSDPPGAEITLDGESVGETPLELDVEAGMHLISVRKKGHGTVEREMQSERGVTETVSFKLDRAKQGWITEKEPWGWISLGVGVASLGAGIGLLAADENPYKRDCEGTNIDDSGTCRFRYNTLGTGVAFTVVGVALVATGVTLVILDRKANKKGSSLRASIGPRGFALSGSF